jgi:hypothetical protein
MQHEVCYKILKQNTTKYQTLTNLASSDVDTCVEAGRLLVADLYDPKGSAKSVHRDLNKLRVKLSMLALSICSHFSIHTLKVT